MKIGDVDYQKVLELFRALRAREVEYVVVGAIALGLNGIVRATRDLDLCVRPTAENISRLRAALTDVWADPAVAGIDAAELAGEIGVVSYVPPAGEILIDITTGLGEGFCFEQIEYHEVDAGGVVARVATPGMLHRTKKATPRLQDAADAHALHEQLGVGED